jgi:ParB-like chromosome segregation protein Spo0J
MEQITNYKFHEIADIFPLMSEESFASLVKDIEKNGQIEPIWVTGNKIIDGRNRYKACLQLGIEPNAIEYGGESKDLVSFVVSLNLHRRHLNESQRAMVASKLANMRKGYNTSIDVLVSQPEAANLLNVSLPSVQRAKQVQQKAIPELAEQVSQGNVAVSTAALVAELPAEEQTEIVAKGEKEILEAAKTIRAKKAEERKKIVDPDIPVDSNRERTRTAWHGIIDKMGTFLFNARTEETIELTVDNLSERERSSYFTHAVRLRDSLNKWIEILENKGAKQL